VWDKLAKICADYLQKGSKAFIQGEMQTRSYEDKDGNKRYSTEIIVREMKILTSRQNSGGSREEQPPVPESSIGQDVPF
jgi:single-strand DNA-binding protein